MTGRVSGVFAALCLLSASTWIVDQYWISPLAGLQRIALHDFILCLLFAIASRHARGTRRQPGQSLRIAVWGAALLAIPWVLIAFAGGAVSTFTTALVFTLVPVVVIFVIAQRTGLGSSANPFSLLGPALAGTAGAALLLPFSLPSSTSGLLWLTAILAAAMFAGVAALQLHVLLAQLEPSVAAANLAGATALVCAAFSLHGWVPLHAMSARDMLLELTVTLLLDGPILLLTAWLLRAMPPVAFSSRYLLIPLLTIAEGYVLLRPETNWSLILGVLLLTAATLSLLKVPTDPHGNHS